MYDVLIVGGGPAGLAAAIYARRALLRTAVIEKDYMGRGVIAAADKVENYPGLPGVSGFDLADAFHAQAKALGAEFPEQEIVSLQKEADCFTLRTRTGETLHAGTVIYAAGTSYRRLSVPGAELLGVSYCATCDGLFYQGQEVAVIGGGDKAFDDALYLSRMASRVYLIHRKASPRAGALLQKQAAETENIRLLSETQVTAVLGESRVTGLRILREGEEQTLPVRGVFTAIGSVPNTGLLTDLGVLDAQGYVMAGEDCVTAVPGLLAAGDVRTKPLRQVITAAADGANAAAAAESYLRK